MIGIDIGCKFVKVCKILNMGKKDLSFVAAMKNVSNMDDVSKISLISDLLKKMDLRNDSAFLSVGGKDIINRELVLPKSKINSKNLKNNIISEIQTSTSEDLSNMYTACSVMRSISDTEYCVLFSAVPREKIDSKFSIANAIQNIKVEGVSMEALALVNAFINFGPSYKESESIILINIGYTNSNLVVLNNKELVFIKDIEFGGQDVTKDISSFYVIPEKLSEEVKRREDLKKKIDFNMRNVLKKTASVLVETIFRTIEHCVTRQFIISVDRIVLTGGGALTEGIDNFIEDTLGIPTDKWNPLANNEVVGYTNKDCGYFLPVALGLALEKEQE